MCIFFLKTLLIVSKGPAGIPASQRATTASPQYTRLVYTCTISSYNTYAYSFSVMKFEQLTFPTVM